MTLASLALSENTALDLALAKMTSRSSFGI